VHLMSATGINLGANEAGAAQSGLFVRLMYQYMRRFHSTVVYGTSSPDWDQHAFIAANESSDWRVSDDLMLPLTIELWLRGRNNVDVLYASGDFSLVSLTVACPLFRLRGDFGTLSPHRSSQRFLRVIAGCRLICSIMKQSRHRSSLAPAATWLTSPWSSSLSLGLAGKMFRKQRARAPGQHGATNPCTGPAKLTAPRRSCPALGSSWWDDFPR